MPEKQSFAPLGLLVAVVAFVGPCGAGFSQFNKIDCGSSDHAKVVQCEASVNRASLRALLGQAGPLAAGLGLVLYRRRRGQPDASKGAWITLGAASIAIVLAAYIAGRGAVDAQDDPGSLAPPDIEIDAQHR